VIRPAPITAVVPVVFFSGNSVFIKSPKNSSWHLALMDNQNGVVWL
jgi:hypothetical protein